MCLGLGLARAAAADPSVPADLATYSEAGIRIGGDTIYSGKVGFAALDAAQELVWFTSGDTLQVIDLRDPAKKPVVIVKKVPNVGFSLEGFSTVEAGTIPSQVYLVLDVDKRSVSAGEGVYAVVDQEGTKRLKKDVRKAKLVGGAWLKAQKSRKARAQPPEPKPRPDPPALTLPADTMQCDGYENSCGDTMWLGATPYQLVILVGACGDACFRGCALYDPGKKLFAPIGESAPWGPIKPKLASAPCGDIKLDATGSRFYENTKACTIDAKQVACVDLGDWNAFGWIARP